jgi:hypothetical protein
VTITDLRDAMGRMAALMAAERAATDALIASYVDAANHWRDRHAKLKAAVGGVLSENGCECECEHHHEGEEHDDNCKRCLGCRVDAAMCKA